MNSPSARRWGTLLFLISLGIGSGGRGQQPASESGNAQDQQAEGPESGLGQGREPAPDLPLTVEEQIKALTAPGAAEKALDAKKKPKPPIEFFRSQVAPFDVLPFIKARHWTTLSLEMRANNADYEGVLQTAPIPFRGQSMEIVFGRKANVVKGQQSRLSLQMMLPRDAKMLNLELLRPDAIRSDGLWPASLMPLETHQMLIPILAKSPNSYARWSSYQALLPPSEDDNRDPILRDRRRYYRMIIPLVPEKPLLSSHPLTWTTTSHVIWDGFSPEGLDVGQQQAMLDWLHWGGQLIIVGGADPSLAPLKDSFLGPYLPAEAGGESVNLTEADFEDLSRKYRPPRFISVVDMIEDETLVGPPAPQSRYKPVDKIRPAAGRPVFLMGLRPLPGSSSLPLGDPRHHVMGVEQRVGRGRVLILGFNPTDPAFARWSGMDTFIRRVILRHGEEKQGGSILSGPELTWVRFLGRDMGAQAPSSEDVASGPLLDAIAQKAVAPRNSGDPNDEVFPQAPVAAWVDQADMPLKCRTVLEDASGISIPARPFVLKVLLVYVVILVPLNWMFCRLVFKRREWAWAMIPLLALIFAVAVERSAARELGYESACDEIDLLEVQGGFRHAHLNRFAALYSTGRVQFTVSYPQDPTALALPMNIENNLKGQREARSTWQSTPIAALVGFQVQPRALAMFRAEQMTTLSGTINLVPADGTSPRRIANGTDLDLHEARLVDGSGKEKETIHLGTILAGQTVEVRENPEAKTGTGDPAETIGWTNVGTFVDSLSGYNGGRPEDAGELRLVAWTPGPRPQQTLSPAVDRVRGFTLVMAHLGYGLPGPEDPAYDSLSTNDPPRPQTPTAPPGTSAPTAPLPDAGPEASGSPPPTEAVRP